MMCSLAYFINLLGFYPFPFNGVVTVSCCTTQIFIVLMYMYVACVLFDVSEK